MSLDSPEVSAESAAAEPAVKAVVQYQQGSTPVFGKPLHTSKTLWFCAFALAVITLEGQLHLLQPYLKPNVYAVISVVVTVGAAVLRLVTNQGIRGFVRLPDLPQQETPLKSTSVGGGE